jgi:mannosyltransferase
VLVRGVMQAGLWAGQVLKLSPSRSRGVAIGLNVGMMVVSALSVAFVFGPKQDYEGAMQYIESVKQAGDQVVTVSLTAFIYQDFYKTDWKPVTTLDALNEVRTQASRTWVVYTFQPVLESVYPQIMQSIQKDFEILKVFPGTVENGTIFVGRAIQSP